MRIISVHLLPFLITCFLRPKSGNFSLIEKCRCTLTWYESALRWSRVHSGELEERVEVKLRSVLRWSWVRSGELEERVEVKLSAFRCTWGARWGEVECIQVNLRSVLRWSWVHSGELERVEVKLSAFRWTWGACWGEVEGHVYGCPHTPISKLTAKYSVNQLYILVSGQNATFCYLKCGASTQVSKSGGRWTVIQHTPNSQQR